MKVKTLIEYLRNFDGDAEVWLEVGTGRAPLDPQACMSESDFGSDETCLVLVGKMEAR